MRIKLFLVYLLFVPLLYAGQITIRFIDQNENPIPYVVVQTQRQTTISDVSGMIVINAEDEIFSIQRLGFRSVQKTAEQLRQAPIVILHRLPIQSESIIIRSEAENLPFRMSSETRRIEISDLNRVYSSVDDILKDIQAINVRGVRLAGERQTVSLGGHQGRHTIIMLDNVVLNPSGQAVDLSSIPASQIESIEIVKNNVSVETGSGGIAGMIVLHTKRARRENQIFFSQSIGSFGSHKQNLGFQLFRNTLSVRANVSSVQAKNDFEYERRGQTLTRDNNAISILNLSTELQYDLSRHRFTYSFHYQDFDKQLPGPVNFLNLYRGAYQKGTVTHHNLLYSTRFNVFDSPLRFDTQGYHIRNKSLYNNTKAPFTIYHAKDENIQQIQGVKTGLAQSFEYGLFDFTTNIGSEYKRETFQSRNMLRNVNVFDVEQETFSVYASQAVAKDFYLWIPEIIGAARIDENNKFDTHTSWRAEFNNYFYTRIPFQIKSSLGTSYTIPSFFDLYWRGDSQSSGNPDLLPEESLGWRIEASTGTNPSIGAARWNNKTKNLIFWYRSLQGWRPANLANAEINNWEVFGQYNFLRGQNFRFNYVRTIAKNKTKGGDLYGKYLIYTPAWNWDLQLNLRAGLLSQSIGYIATGEQWTTRDQLIPPLKGYEVLNTRSAIDFNLWRVSSNLNFSIYNLLDRKYEIYPFTPEPGRHWEVQIGFTIK